MPPQSNSLAPVGLTRADFNKYYWFSSLQMVTVVNPTEKDFPFMVEMRHYMVRAGEQESFVGPIANLYLNHMTKTIAQDEDRLEMLADVTYMASYYKQLIIEVKDLAPQYDPTNNWQHRMKQEGAEVPPWVQAAPQTQPVAQQTAPTPPWEQPPPLTPNTERASDVAVTAPPMAPPPVKPQAPPASPESKDETREFELNGIAFKSVTKDGETSYFKNDKEIELAAFSKAASML